jgi:hypothetical protein
MFIADEILRDAELLQLTRHTAVKQTDLSPSIKPAAWQLVLHHHIVMRFSGFA